ncbi:MAG: autotransporter outer membrane beta-barrel domain-containing protein [Chthoniobacter sp.]
MASPSTARSLPLNIHDDNVDSLTTAFGIKASYDWSLGHVMIKPELRAAWQHQYGDSSYAVESSFASGPGGQFHRQRPAAGPRQRLGRRRLRRATERTLQTPTSITTVNWAGKTICPPPFPAACVWRFRECHDPWKTWPLVAR